MMLSVIVFECYRVMVFEEEELKHNNTEIPKHSTPMRILFTLPHYFRPSRRGFHGSEREASERIASLTRCLSALHQHFGEKTQGVLDGPRQRVVPANDVLENQLEVVVCTTGSDHLLAELPAGLCRPKATDVPPRLLGYACHAVLRDRLDQFDFFCYLEDDVLLDDPLFFQKLTWFNRLAGDEALLQPNRFELTLLPRLHKVYVDGNLVDTTLSARFQDVTQDPHLTASLMDTNLSFRRVDNPHAGCFFLNAAQMARWAAAPYFLDHADGFWGPLESAATLGIMRTFKVYKPAPENAGFLEIEHLDPRYEVHPSGKGDSSALTFSVKKKTEPAPPASKQCRHVEVLPQPLPYTPDLAAQWGLCGLHYGCGWNLREGWVNTDLESRVDAQGRRTPVGRLALLDKQFFYLQHDATRPFPFQDESFDWVYAEHLIEHLTLHDAVVWLKDVRRLLKPGGCLRLSTPDLRQYMAGYLDEQGRFFEEHRNRLLKLGLKNIPQRRAWMVNQIFQKWGHQWIYDLDELTFALRQAGFDPAGVTECRYRQGRVPAVYALDLPIRNDESIYVEVVR